MPILTLAYHRIGSGKYSNQLATFREHLEWIKDTYPVVLPGDPVSKTELAICLTFDDATFDFYQYVYPLLKCYKLRVLLGVPVHYILEETTLNKETRLDVPYALAMQEGIFENKAPFCTWNELREMVESGYVQLASHSFKHCNLTFGFVNLHREIIRSKEVLESHIPQVITSFIYPFGKYTPAVHDIVTSHYPYVFRLGSSLNWGWNNEKKPLCRIIGDNMEGAHALFSLKKLARYALKSII